MKITVKASGFKEGQELFKLAASRFPAARDKELRALGEKSITHLVRTIKQGELNLAPKAHSDGNPPLVKTGVYCESFEAEVKGGELTIASQGMNANMSNEDLGELLEYGTDTMPARPHVRPLNLWVEKQLPAVGERIVNGLLGRG